MNVAKTIEGIHSQIKGSGADGEAKMKAILKTLQTDSDYDVKFYAQRAARKYE